jgi:hypothetical protein
MCIFFNVSQRLGAANERACRSTQADLAASSCKSLQRQQFMNRLPVVDDRPAAKASGRIASAGAPDAAA